MENNNSNKSDRRRQSNNSVPNSLSKKGRMTLTEKSHTHSFTDESETEKVENGSDGKWQTERKIDRKYTAYVLRTNKQPNEWMKREREKKEEIKAKMEKTTTTLSEKLCLCQS